MQCLAVIFPDIFLAVHAGCRIVRDQSIRKIQRGMNHFFFYIIEDSFRFQYLSRDQRVKNIERVQHGQLRIRFRLKFQGMFNNGFHGVFIGILPEKIIDPLKFSLVVCFIVLQSRQQLFKIAAQGAAGHFFQVENHVTNGIRLSVIKKVTDKMCDSAGHHIIKDGGVVNDSQIDLIENLIKIQTVVPEKKTGTGSILLEKSPISAIFFHFRMDLQKQKHIQLFQFLNQNLKIGNGIFPEIVFRVIPVGRHICRDLCIGSQSLLTADIMIVGGYLFKVFLIDTAGIASPDQMILI